MQSSLVLSVICVSLSGCGTTALRMEESKVTDGNRIVCRDVVPVGSHLKERVCVTVADAAEESKQARAALEQVQQRRAADALLERNGRRASGPW